MRALLLQQKASRWIGRGAQIAFGSALIWWLFRSGLVDGAELLARLREADGMKLGLATACFALSTLAIATRSWLLLPARVGLRYCVSLTLLQQALVNFVPWRLGELSYPLLLRRDHQLPMAQGAAMLVAIRLADLAVTLCFGLAGAVRLGIDLRWIGVVGALGASALAVAALLGRSILPALTGRLLHEGKAAVAPLRDPRRGAGFCALTALVFGLAVIQSRLILESFGLSIELIDLAVLQAFSLVFSLLPIHPPGGWGTADTFQLLLLERLSYGPGGMAAAILAAHSVYTLLFLVGGTAGWLLHNKLGTAPVSATARLPK
jgi:uncharacterized membrane protein YbhN (UPF0104 family)